MTQRFFGGTVVGNWEEIEVGKALSVPNKKEPQVFARGYEWYGLLIVIVDSRDDGISVSVDDARKISASLIEVLNKIDGGAQ
jgi:hypothetical protein